MEADTELLEGWLPYILLCALIFILVIFSCYEDWQQRRRHLPQYQRQQEYYQRRHQQHYQQPHYQQRSQPQKYPQAPSWPRPTTTTVPQPAHRPPVQQGPSTLVWHQPKPQAVPKLPTVPKPRTAPKPPTVPKSSTVWYRPEPSTKRRLSDPYPVLIGDDVEPRESAYYQQLRTRAQEEGDAMAAAFDASKIAYQSGKRAKAKKLSNEGKKHKAEMERLNKEAGDWIFKQVNLDSTPGVIDLHGLFVKEAVEKAEAAVQAAQARGDVQLRIIVGKGLHSQGDAKIKPAIEKLMVKYQLNVQIDPRNVGVLVVQLGGRDECGIGPSEVTRLLERDDEQRVLMYV